MRLNKASIALTLSLAISGTSQAGFFDNLFNFGQESAGSVVEGTTSAVKSVGSTIANSASFITSNLTELKIKSKLGDSDAEYALAVIYDTGNGVEVDKAKAVDLYEDAANGGVMLAQFALAQKYDKGEGVAQNDQKALQRYLEAAEQGYARAQYDAAVKYDNGVGTLEDNTLALQWYQKAAEQGHIEAQYSAGQLLLKGEGVEADSAAAKWLLSAAKKGHTNAQIAMGSLYMNATGVDHNLDEALAWFTEANDQQGITSTQYKIALSLSGIDDKKSFEWHFKAAEKGHTASQNAVASMYDTGTGVALDHFNAIEWYHEAGNSEGVTQSQNNLAKSYADRSEFENAIVWYEKAGNQGGITASQNSFGDALTASGEFENAIVWYEKSDNQDGIVTAQISIAKSLLGKDDDQALAWFLEAKDTAGILEFANSQLGVDNYKALQWF
ncbi:MAG: tetratricopeptide repeat protein, partial [Gammaproteobacteria bacterium]